MSRHAVSIVFVATLTCCWAHAQQAGDNPYLLPAGLDKQQLTERLNQMRTRPESVRLRSGFRDAVFDAADRLLDDSPDEAQRKIAVLAKLEILQDLASNGDNNADEQVRQLLEEFADDEKLTSDRSFRFFVLEQTALAADELDDEQAMRLLIKLDDHFAAGRPTKRDLRLASRTVRIINRLQDDRIAAAAYVHFGELFTTSMHRRLRLYGNKTAKQGKKPSYVGKPIELSGNTHDGEPFDATTVQGKLIVVYFGAAWSQPTEKAIEQLKTAAKNHSTKDLQIVGVDVDGNRAATAEFARKHNIAWPIIMDASPDSLIDRYTMFGVPTLLLVGRDGKIIAVRLQVEEFLKRLDELIQSTD